VPKSPVPTRELVWVNRNGMTTPISNIRRVYAWPQVSPDGRQIAVVVLPEGDLWLFDLKREAWTRLTAEGDIRTPVWSPDGKQIFFASNRDGPFSVYAAASDGSQPPRQLTHDPKSWSFPVAVSRDGHSLVLLRSQPGGVTDLWVIDPSRPDTERLLMTTHEGTNADLSPDAHWIAFPSNETGRLEIYLSTFPSAGRKWPVSIEGGNYPRFRADGHELFYRNGKKTMAVDISLGPEPSFGKPRMLFEGDYKDAFGVTPDGQRFVHLRSEPQPPALQLNVITGLFANARP